MADLVEVFRPRTLAEAVVVESMLEAYGIVGYIANGNLCRVVPFAGDVPGCGMRVMVDTRDAEEARNLLAPGVAIEDES